MKFNGRADPTDMSENVKILFLYDLQLCSSNPKFEGGEKMSIFLA
jgi:hypothetical protein